MIYEVNLIALALITMQKSMHLDLSLERSLTETNLLKTSVAQAKRRMS